MINRKLKASLLGSAALLALAIAATSIGPVVAAQGKDGKDNNNNNNNNDNNNNNNNNNNAADPNALKTKYPIKHLVVIFNENVSFDHYFGTYPNAANVEGEPLFEPGKNTQRDINNLLSSPALLTNNPNLNLANGAGAANPFRLDRTQANTADQGHGYTPEQKAYDAGKTCSRPTPARAPRVARARSAPPRRCWVISTAIPSPHCGITPRTTP
jgi:phospholipase C